MNIFRELFDHYLAARRSKNLFGRPTILDTLARGNRTDQLSDALNQRLVTGAHSGLDELLAQLEVGS